MTSETAQAEPYHITVLLLEQFAMIAFASTIEPFREANWIVGSKMYEIKVVSQDGNPVRASNGLSINVDGSMESVTSSPMVIVCSSWDPHLYTTQKMLSWLRKLARQGAKIGGVETGAYVLARAGLLDGYKATIHWENIESFIETFPQVRITANIFEIDRGRFSASGASAALDMMLHFIEVHHGASVASAVADGFIYSRVRQGENPQRLESSGRLNVTHPRLIRLLKFLDLNLDKHLDVAQMSMSEGVSDREVRRLFSLYLNVTPQAYHRSLRLQKARSLLRQTNISVTEVSVCCGFSSSSDFSRAFKREFGQQPAADRKEIHYLERPSEQGAIIDSHQLAN